MPWRNYGQVSFAGTKKRECEPLLVDSEGDITFSPIRDKHTIGSPNFHTAWEQFCFVFRVQVVVAVIGI